MKVGKEVARYVRYERVGDEPIRKHVISLRAGGMSLGRYERGGKKSQWRHHRRFQPKTAVAEARRVFVDQMQYKEVRGPEGSGPREERSGWAPVIEESVARARRKKSMGPSREPRRPSEHPAASPPAPLAA